MALFYTIIAFRLSAGFGLLVLIIGDPLYIIIVMAFWRLLLEAFVVVFGSPRTSTRCASAAAAEAQGIRRRSDPFVDVMRWYVDTRVDSRHCGTARTKS